MDDGQRITHRFGHTQLELKPPLAGTTVSLVMSLLATSIIFMLFAQRLRLIASTWPKVTYMQILLLLLFGHLWLCVVASTIVQFGGFHLDQNLSACNAASITCIAGFRVTKVFLCMFLMERVYLVRGSQGRRFKSKVYLFNLLGLVVAYIVWIPIFIIFRINELNHGICIIGVQQRLAAAGLTIDLVFILWLTTWFVVPLVKSLKFAANWRPELYSSRSTDLMQDFYTENMLRLSRKTCLASVFTLTSTILHSSMTVVYNGASSWLCLLMCKLDALLCVIVIGWVTTKQDMNPPQAPPSSRAGMDVEACILCGTPFATLRTDLPITPPKRFTLMVGEAHPGQLVPGSAQLGTIRAVGLPNGEAWEDASQEGDERRQRVSNP